MQNTLARITCQSPRSSSASSLQKSSHWPPGRQRVIYKTTVIIQFIYVTCFIIINHPVLWDPPVNYYSISRQQGSTFNLRPKRVCSRSLFLTSSSDTDCILTFSFGLFVPTLRWFCHLRSTICYDMIGLIVLSMAPAVWNSLSPITKSSATITTFKAQPKTELFAAAYDSV